MISRRKKSAITYPKLSVIVRSLFGIPASSYTSKRIFSATGRILEERRKNLSDDTVDYLLEISRRLHFNIRQGIGYEKSLPCTSLHKTKKT